MTETTRLPMLVQGLIGRTEIQIFDPDGDPMVTLELDPFQTRLLTRALAGICLEGLPTGPSLPTLDALAAGEAVARKASLVASAGPLGPVMAALAHLLAVALVIAGHLPEETRNGSRIIAASAGVANALLGTARSQ